KLFMKAAPNVSDHIPTTIAPITTALRPLCLHTFRHASIASIRISLEPHRFNYLHPLYFPDRITRQDDRHKKNSIRLVREDHRIKRERIDRFHAERFHHLAYLFREANWIFVKIDEHREAKADAREHTHYAHHQYFEEHEAL